MVSSTLANWTNLALSQC